MKNTVFLCRLEEISDPGSRGFRVETADGPRELMVIRHGGRVHGYVNACPHTGVCLDWQPGQFLNLDRTRIICATHGAEFRIEDGFCVQGPCAGDHLQRVSVVVDGAGRVLFTPVAPGCGS